MDEDCDGTRDEDYSADITCGVGECVASGTQSCRNGETSDDCTPLSPPARSDTTCDGRDDDCSGQADEDFVPYADSCGVGACESTGTVTCENGSTTSDCRPGEPAASDATCDGVDDDCNGVADEDYDNSETDCSVGSCESYGKLTCEAGGEVDSCVTPDDACIEGKPVCDGKTACLGTTSCTGAACACEELTCTPPAGGGAVCPGDGRICTGTDQCGNPCGCQAAECKATQEPTACDDNFAYMGEDQCGDPCNATDRCASVNLTCEKNQECGIDLCDGSFCDCRAEECVLTEKVACPHSKTYCDSVGTCSGEWCNCRAPECTGTYMCLNESTSCPVDECGGRTCGACTECANGCNSSTGRCSLVIGDVVGPVTGQLVGPRTLSDGGTTGLLRGALQRILGF